MKKGRVRITGVDREGRETILALIASGEPFGELCFCGGPTEERRSAARAVADSLAFEVPNEIAESVLSEFLKAHQMPSRKTAKFEYCLSLVFR